MVEQQQPEAPQWLIWVRASAGPAAIVGGLQLLPMSYWLGVAVVHVGFLISLAEIIWEPFILLKDYRLQIGMLATLICFWTLTELFCIGPTLVQPALAVDVVDYGLGHPDEAGRIGEVIWKPVFYDIRMFVANRGDEDYEGLVIEVMTDLNIAHVGRFGKCLDGSVSQAIKMGGLIARDPTGAIIESPNGEGPFHITVPSGIPGVPGKSFGAIGTYSPIWKIMCDRVRKKDTVEFVIAVVNLEKRTFNILPAQRPKYVHVYVEYQSLGHRTHKQNFHLPIFAREDLLPK